MTATLSSSNSFRVWQPQYAAHGIATFPVEISPDRKKPMVSRYGKFGLPASAKLARKYPEATAIGFMVGQRSGLTILDVDTTDHRVLADALDRHGSTPLIVRSGSGHHQAWYRNNGERRLIRPEKDRPIDILGSGYVVAPPSRGLRGDYQFIRGSLDDLDRLPVMRNVTAPPISSQDGDPEQAQAPDFLPGQTAVAGNRNNTLWRHCMRQAHSCDDLEALIDVARTANEGYLPPMTDAEVVKTAKSAWRITETGENRIGHTGAWLPTAEVNDLFRANPDALALLTLLRANQGPQAIFIVANGYAATIGWTPKRLAKARRYLEQSHLVMVRMPSLKNGPAKYRWRRPPSPVTPMSVSEIIEREGRRRRGVG